MIVLTPNPSPDHQGDGRRDRAAGGSELRDGYLAVEAGKDFRPEEGGGSSSHRRLKQRENLISIYGEHRILHAQPTDEPAPGALQDGDGTNIGTAPIKEKISGLDIFGKLADIPPADIGLIESVTIPTSSGGIVMGPFTDVADTVGQFRSRAWYGIGPRSRTYDVLQADVRENRSGSCTKPCLREERGIRSPIPQYRDRLCLSTQPPQRRV